MCQLPSITSGGGGFTRQVTTTIQNRSTELVWQMFTNKSFLLITQYGKIPNLYSVKFDMQPLERPLTSTDAGDYYCSLRRDSSVEMHVSVPVTMSCLLGADKVQTRSVIQYLINNTKLQSSAYDLVMAVGLKECNGTVLAELAAALNSIL